jgi:hypothetical protein
VSDDDRQNNVLFLYLFLNRKCLLTSCCYDWNWTVNPAYIKRAQRRWTQGLLDQYF